MPKYFLWLERRTKVKKKKVWIWKATTLYMQCKPLFKKLNCLKVQYSLEILIGYSSSNFTLIEGQNMFFDVIISCLSSYSWLCIYWSFSLIYVFSCRSNSNQIYIFFINSWVEFYYRLFNFYTNDFFVLSLKSLWWGENMET